MKFSKLPALFGAGALLVGLSTSACGLFSNGPTTITGKYVCTQTVNGHKENAYCVQDSNGNNYYVSWLIYRQIVLNADESKYLPASYTNDSDHSVSDADVPAAYHPGGVDDPVHVDPVEVHPVIVDGR